MKYSHNIILQISRFLIRLKEYNEIESNRIAAICEKLNFPELSKQNNILFY